MKQQGLIANLNNSIDNFIFENKAYLREMIIDWL